MIGKKSIYLQKKKRKKKQFRTFLFLQACRKAKLEIIEGIVKKGIS